MKNVADIYALSPMQHLMLLHARTTQGEMDVLFNQIVYRIDGALDEATYQQSWQLMVDRHPALRSIFVWQDGQEPVQIVRETAELPWQTLDWRSQSETDQQAALAQLLSDDRATGFEMMQAPLMRLRLIRMAENRYWLLWSSHHLIVDRWCIGVLFGEIKTAYEAYVASGSPLLPPAPRYRDYIAWLAAQDKAQAADFWRETLQGVTVQPLPLSAEHENEAAVIATRAHQIDGSTLAGLQRFARDNNLTMGTLVTAAWAVVLGAATGSDDTLFGLTVSGRPAELPQISSAVGCFINNVPLRASLPPEQPLPAWLTAVQEAQLALQPFEYASPPQIRTWSKLTFQGPLFETLVVLQAPVAYAMPNGLEVAFERGGMQTGYPISLSALPHDDNLQLTVTYDSLRASEPLIRQLLHALIAVLEAMPKEAQATVANLRREAQRHVQATTTPEAAKGEDKVRPYFPPRTPIEQALAQIWADVLGQTRVSLEDTFAELGGDSIQAIQLIDRVEKQLGEKVPISLLLRNPTIADMADAIGHTADGIATDPILLPINENGSKPPFFYVHGIYGDLSSLTNVVPYLQPDQPIYGLQAVGLHPDYEPDRTVEAMAAHYVEAIRKTQPHGPYYLGGYCFGGVVAHEIARQLEEQGQQIALLAIIEGTAPQQFHDLQPLLNTDRLQLLLHSAVYWVQGYEAFGGRRIQRRIRRRLGLGKAGKNGSTHQDADDELGNLADYNAVRPELQHQLSELNIEAIAQFTPQPICGHVTLIRAQKLRLGRAARGGIDPKRGWSALAKSGVTVHYVDGTHQGILRQPYAAGLAATLNVLLSEAQAAALAAPA